MDTLRKETLTAAGIDVDNALERFMGKDDFLEEIRSGCELSKTCGSGGEAGCRGGAAGFTHDEGNVR